MQQISKAGTPALSYFCMGKYWLVMFGGTARQPVAVSHMEKQGQAECKRQGKTTQMIAHSSIRNENRKYLAHLDSAVAIRHLPL